MADVLKLADQLWRGEISTSQPEHHPFAAVNELTELGASVAFWKGFVNLTVLRTGDGLVLIDTGSYHPGLRQQVFDAVREWSRDALHTAIYTHGHIDHAYGLPPFLAEADELERRKPDIVGHRDVAPRMKRYAETQGYNTVINTRQFGIPIRFPGDSIPPTVTYETSLKLRVGDQPLELFHARGETDDHTWVYLPNERVLCTGDLFIWAVPNAGNPQKVQRYCIEWAHALRRMAALEPQILLPGHGLPIEGESRVRSALLDTADYLQSIYDQTVALMNGGATVDDLIHGVWPSAHLASKPYLQPVYDEPEFIVRNIHRCLGGWYSGIASELKPAPHAEQAREIATLAGGSTALVERARALADAGNFRMACHLCDWAAEASPDSHDVHAVRAEIYDRRTASESSTMSRGVFGDAARRARERADAAQPPDRKA